MLDDDVEYVLEMIPFNEEYGGPSGQRYSSWTARRSPTLAQLRERFGGDRGALTDPAGQEHYFNLSWPKYHPQTRFRVRWHKLDSQSKGQTS